MDTSGILAAVLGLGIFIFVICFAVIILLIIANWKLMTKAGEQGWKSIVPVYNVWTMCQIVGLSPYWIIEIFAVSFLTSFISEFFADDSVIASLLSLVNSANTIYFNVIYAISVAKSYGKDTSFGIANFFFSAITTPILAFGSSQYVGQQPMSDPVMKFILDTFNIKDDKTGRMNNMGNMNNGMNNNMNNNMPNMNNGMNNNMNNNMPNMNNGMNNNMNNNMPNMNNGMNNNMNNMNNGVQENRFCPNCGSKVEAGDSFCLGCGTKLN